MALHTGYRAVTESRLSNFYLTFFLLLMVPIFYLLAGSGNSLLLTPLDSAAVPLSDATATENTGLSPSQPLRMWKRTAVWPAQH